MKHPALMLILLVLSACAGLPQKPNEPPDGWSCTPDGACWPTDFKTTKHYRYKWVADTDAVADICVKTNSPTPYACILMQHSDNPIIILPEKFTPAQQACGWTIADTKRHEEGHGEELTVHGMIMPRACNG